MAYLDVYANPSPKSRPAIPFLLDLQSNLLAGLATRFVIPLYRADAATVAAIGRLTPLLQFQDLDLVAMVPEAAGIATHRLGAAVGTLPDARDAVVAALDLLVTGS